MKIPFVGLILVAALAVNPLSARTLSFPPQNFECEIADTWKLLSATGARVEAIDGSGNDLSISTRLQDATLSLDSPAFLQSATDFVQSGAPDAARSARSAKLIFRISRDGLPRRRGGRS